MRRIAHVSDERGLTMAEVLVALVIASLIVTFIGGYAPELLARERLHGGLYAVQSDVQAARACAIEHNRQCQFVLNTNDLSLQIVDLHDPSSSGDDEVLGRGRISDRIAFASPTGGSAITLSDLGGGKYGLTFGGDGTVVAGAGVVNLRSSAYYARISVYGAGGARTERWTGSAWTTGFAHD